MLINNRGRTKLQNTMCELNFVGKTQTVIATPTKINSP